MLPPVLSCPRAKSSPCPPRRARGRAPPVRRGSCLCRLLRCRREPVELRKRRAAVDNLCGLFNAVRQCQAVQTEVQRDTGVQQNLLALCALLLAGENAGTLTEEGAKRLDISGHLNAGAPVCPPEGDAGTGMVATNAVKQRTGNVSAGTSSFSMIVLEKDLSKPYEMIDMVTTPDGSLVAMVHCNNCTSDLNAWVNLFKEYQELLGIPVNMDEIYSKLYNIALTGDTDCGGLLSYNYISGEPVTGLAEGRPLFIRSANDKFSLANFMRTHLYASVGVLKIGNDILFNDEKVKVDRITGHGGLFRTKGVGQRILAAAINSPISVMETAGEGGAWGIALLGSYLVNNDKKQSLADFLDENVFAGDAGIEVSPTLEDVAGFNAYIESYKAGLPIEEAAVRFK